MTEDTQPKGIRWSVRTGLVIVLVLSVQIIGCAKKPLSSDNPESAPVVNMFEKGFRFYENAQFDKALETYQAAAIAASGTDDPALLADIHYRMGLTSLYLEKYSEAIASYGEALKLIRKIGKRSIEGSLLNSIGVVHQIRGEVSSAKIYYEQALEISKEVEDSLGEARTLANMGFVYFAERRYLESLECFQRAEAFFKEIAPYKYREFGAVLTQKGVIYSRLGQFGKALTCHLKAKKAYEKIGNKKGVSATLNNMGNVRHSQKKYRAAIETYEKALKIRKAIGDRTGTAETLNNMALTYSVLGKAPQAVDVLERALRISRELKNFGQEAAILDSLGTVYKSLSQYENSLEFYHQALSAWWFLGDKSSELITIGNIGAVLELMNQYEKAIIFYQQSVNITQEIRNRLEILPEHQQRAYVETVDHVYRNFSKLLLKQGRVIEAIQLVDLLKVREIEQEIPTVRGGQGGTPYPEIIVLYEDFQRQAISNAQELKQLRKIPVEARTEDQKDRIAQLYRFQRTLQRRFRDFLDSSDVLKKMRRVRRLNNARSDEYINSEPRELLGIWNRLNQLSSSEIVLFYPLILEDRIELLLATPHNPPFRHTVHIPRDMLEQTIVDLRAALGGGKSDVTLYAKRFYNWLIDPLMSYLADAHTKTIIYLPDEKLRYIPLSAFYDGKKWLAQRFEIFNIASLSLSNLNRRRRQSLRVLAGAFWHGSHTIQIKGRNVIFHGLQYAKTEVDDLASAIPETKVLVDMNFSRESAIPNLNDYSVIHFATHAGIVPGSPLESFILLGSGEAIRYEEVRELFLQNVELFVLSACETALDNVLDDGREILGFGYLIRQAGADASIASLWKVNDESTQRLMTAFYRAYKREGNSKAKALQLAQNALISQKIGTDNNSSRSVKFAGNGAVEAGARKFPEFSHPYYWAAFIMIGNGL